MSTLTRTLRNLRRIGVRPPDAGDTKAGTLIALDKYGNKYYENLEEELPLRTRWIDFKDAEFDPKPVHILSPAGNELYPTPSAPLPNKTEQACLDFLHGRQAAHRRQGSTDGIEGMGTPRTQKEHDSNESGLPSLFNASTRVLRNKQEAHTQRILISKINRTDLTEDFSAHNGHGDVEAAENGGDFVQTQQLSSQQAPGHKIKPKIQVDRPPGQLALVLVEELAVVAELGISVLALAINAWGPNGRLAAIAGILAWSYLFTLTSLRLFVTYTGRSLGLNIWNHTATLFCLQFLLSVLRFRSAIIHPRSPFARNIMIADFTLITLLASIALTTRKGNKAVIIEYQDNLEPSREPLASLFSIVTFGWVDAIIWKGYKKPYEIEDVWNLATKDKAAAIVENYRQVKVTSKLAWHLVKYFRNQLLVQGAWASLGSLFTFAPSLLVMKILQYVEDPYGVPVNAAWFYVILLFCSSCFQAIGDGQALWKGRKICLRLRAIIIGEIYSKALRRKAAAGADTVLGKTASRRMSPGFFQKVINLGRKRKGKEPPPADATSNGKTSALQDSQVNTGTIINLMAIDSFKVAEISAYLHFLLATAPVQLVVAITLLYMILGTSSIAAVLVMILVMPINLLISQKFQSIQKKIMAATDNRIHATNEILQNIRIVKYFAWEHRYGQLVNEKRLVEWRQLRWRYIVWAFASIVWNGVPMIVTLLTFFIYTVIEKKDLVPSVAFTALSLFSILRVPLDQLADMIAHVQESKVSVDRIQEFLSEEETQKYDQLSKVNQIDGGETTIGFSKATFSWGTAGSGESSAFRMINLDIRFNLGQLNVVIGPTASGKTSLLMALLGEMTLLSGNVSLPGAFSREDLKADPATGLTESVAFCAQQAWLVNDTIKQNILFSSPWNQSRYKSVLAACALERDIEILEAGDETLVGEKGITLSGGQKQRISLARALYSNAKHVLLDDCLSAVDSHTSKWIFNNCILGPLMYNRTCILVTHNVALCLPQARYLVVLENGRVMSQGTPDEVVSTGVLGDDALKSMASSASESRIESRVPSNLEEALERENGNDDSNKSQPSSIKAKLQNPGQSSNTRVEGKSQGRVQAKTIILYLSSMGSWCYWLAAIIIFGIQQAGSVAPNIWIREWANSYQLNETLNFINFDKFSISSGFFHSSNKIQLYGCFGDETCMLKSPHRLVLTQNEIQPTSISSEVNVVYYLVGYSILTLGFLVLSFMRELILFAGSLSASWKIHERLLDSVIRAKFKFFDLTPLGQIMNRFSKDIESIDQEVAPVALGMIQCFSSIIVTIVLISIITPGFLVPGFFISIIYFLIGKLFLRSATDLKRLESVQRSPLYQQFGETLSGTTTIRAYGDERRFIRDNLDRVNTHNRPFIYLWATNRWLALRIDVVGALVSFFAGIFVILSVGKLDAGAAGLSMTYAVTFSENVLWFVRLYAANEQNMNSVERIKEYLDVEQEAPAIIPEQQPPSSWPSQGEVEFFNYSTSYRDDLPPVLRNISFKIMPLEKVGVVGRTGAGKSSLALALFRALEATDGKILIDKVDIGTIGLQSLRESITIVPQDPTVFSGTIRSNLDPFGLYTDEEIFTALRRVQLIGSQASVSTHRANSASSEDGSATANESVDAPSEVVNKNIFLNLQSPITESGNNLSQGQKQLLCLARAILKSPKVLLMDEATASIDYNTDSKIQETIRELIGTTITIAHRLQTIIDYNKVLVLENGEVKEFDHPHILLQNKKSMFYGMCETSGDMQSLIDGARRAYRGDTLVDTSS
ncbi:MAG: hypothetical protein M1829_001763 [Trizodia sp. TS-e1964]|nr:MAG: hypothetical protein M1829_001763 [Trizodia sp. TS-e1964]